MNRDEGAYQLSHIYDNLLFSMATSDGGQQTAVRGRHQLLSTRHHHHRLLHQVKTYKITKQMKCKMQMEQGKS